MAKSKRSATQAKKQKQSLRKLRDLGLISPKTDLRKAPSKRAISAIRKFQDVLSRKAVIVKPRDPKSYTAGFRVVGDKVIIPRAKGEKIKLSKTGKITKTTKRGNKTITRTIKIEQVNKITRPSNKAIVFRVPFKKRGTTEIEYRTFTYDGLKTFFAEYLRNINQFDDWAQFIEEESVTFDNAEEAQQWEYEHGKTITGYVSTDVETKPHKGRKNVRKLRRDLKQELGDDE
jgi:hypothetical protein